MRKEKNLTNKTKILVFLSLIMVIILATAITAQKTEYTENTKTICQNGKCSKTLYSGTRFIYEDEEWKLIENARSLKNTNINCVVKKEFNTDPDVECLDYNYTSVKLRITGNKVGFIPIKLFDSAFNEKTGTFDSIELINKKKELFFLFPWLSKELILPLEFKNVLHIGENSTTITLQSYESEYGGSHIMSFSSWDDYNYGSDQQLFAVKAASIGDYHIMMKYNISGYFNTSVVIDNATLFMNLEKNNLDSGEGFDLNAHHVYNNFTVDSQEWLSGDRNGANAITGEINYAERPGTSYYNSVESDEVTFDNTDSIYNYYSWDVSDMLRLEIDAENNDISIWFIPDNMVGSPSYTDYLEFTSEEGGSKPYLEVNFHTDNGQTVPSTPSSILCEEGDCNGVFANSIEIECSGSVDNESDTITYIIDKGNNTGTIEWTTIGNHTIEPYTWDLSGENLGEVYEQLRCKAIDLDGSGNFTEYYTINVSLEIGLYATENEGRSSIVNTSNNELTDPEIYTDAVVYVVYQNGTHSLGTYDKLVMKDNQRWAFNYLAGSDSKQGLDPISTILNFWENLNMTTTQIENSVSDYIINTLN